MSYNQIDKLDGLNSCVKLTTFFISNNKIKGWDELNKLGSLEQLKSVLFIGNPIYGDRAAEENIILVVKRLPNIENVDSKMISASIRNAALAME